MNQYPSQLHSDDSGESTDPFDFRCTTCDRLLRVPRGSEGRDVKCPQCQSVMVVPVKSNQSPANDDRPASSAETSPSSVGDTTNRPAAESSSPTTESADGSRASTEIIEPVPSASARRIKELVDRIVLQVRKVFVGQDELVEGTLAAFFAGGHILIESVPGLGKTLFVRVLGKVLGCRFGRIQFTPDLMPSDITGAPIYNMETQQFEFRPGPVFTQLLLADEINRSPAKTHAALLEIMQEYHVTIDRTTHPIERPFLVMATQNPIEAEGTYNLPEAQLDRFMFKIVADYLNEGEEADVLRMHRDQIDLDELLDQSVETVTTPEEILEVTRLCGEVRIDDRLIDYINAIVRLTRQWPQLHMGASPRAGISLLQGARSLAAFNGRDYAVPDDVRQISLPALRHRVMLTAEAEVEGHEVDRLLQDMIGTIEVPRI